MTPRTSGRHHCRGFTLIELMITVVIVSILVAIAVPSYKSQIREARRTDAKTALLDLAGREERYFNTNSGAYASTPYNLGYSSSTGATWPLTIGGGYYQINTLTAIAGSATAIATFSITALPYPGSDQAKDTNCASFTLTSAGAQTSQNSGGTDTTSTCWH